MKQKGFTLVELLAVVVILSLLFIIVLPKITGSVKTQEKETNKITQEMIFKAAGFYLDDGSNKFPKLNGTTYCIKVSDLVENDYLKEQKDLPKDKFVEANYNNNYTYTLVDTCSERAISLSTEFTYTGDSQTFTAPVSGYYDIELSGAQGGNGSSRGNYTKGVINLEKGEKLYIYVGGAGVAINSTAIGGYNGGGNSTIRNGISGSSGGGATDIRYFGSNTPSTSDLVWNSTTGLNSRIMVAGGGGGYAQGTVTGGLLGMDGHLSTYTYYANVGKGGMQTSGGKVPTKYESAISNGTAGGFGIGGIGGVSGSNATTGGGSGGGGGYYGGSGASGLANGSFPGGSGSSFISGYAGVNAITSASTRTHTNNTIHYSGKYFTGGEMIGARNTGNGKAKITFIGTAHKRTNTKLNGVRYIRDCIAGNSVDGSNAWSEIQVIYKGKNLAKGIIATGFTAKPDDGYPIENVTNGLIDDWANTTSNSTNTLECAVIDLGQRYNLDEIAVWHYWKDGRVYNNHKTEVSDDNNTWTTVMTGAYEETSQGKHVNAYEQGEA